MRLLNLPPDHHAMIRHWIAFTTAHRRALLHGGFLPHGATAGYTSLEGWDDDERVVAVYASDTVCDVSDATRATYVVNATPRGSLPLRLAFAPLSADVFDTLGRRVGEPAFAEGLQDADILSGGYIALRPARAAIIDLDGVMLDSLGVWGEIDADFVRRYGIADGDAVVRRLARIPSLIDAGHYLHGECGVAKSPQEIADEFVELLGDHYRHTLPLFPGVVERLKALKDAGLKLAMVTASPEVHARAAAERTGILGFFDRVYYDEPKTTPDVFLRALEELGATKDQTLVVDDNPAVRAVAEAAGFRTRASLV